MKKVIAFGTFDTFHKGHESFLSQARRYGDFLIVVIARDRIVEKVKGRLPRNSEKERLAAVKKSKLADKVVLGHLSDMYAAIKKYRPDVICLGYDQKSFVKGLPQKLFSFGLKDAKITRARAYKPGIYKSSRLR